MLLYNSMQPELDTLDGGAFDSRSQKIGELLSHITGNHYRDSRECFDELECERIFLGDGSFILARVFFDKERLFGLNNKEQTKPLIDAAKSVINTPLYYCYTHSGHLYFLFCFPRVHEEGSGTHFLIKNAIAWFSEIHEQAAAFFPDMHFLISDLYQGSKTIFLAANSLSHAREYYSFRVEAGPVIQMDSEKQLHGAFISDFGVYRRLAVQAAELIVHKDCDVSLLSRMIADVVLGQCAPSIESVHHHIQMFILTFIDYLGSSGTVNASYISQHRVVYRIMGFETEEEFRKTLFELLYELHKQSITLRAVSKQGRILSIRDYVDANVTRHDLSVMQIADHFSINSSFLTKQFQHYFGVTLNRYIQRRRLKKAQELITESPYATITEIADASGYTDISTMYRAFQSIEGITPGNFRNTAQRNPIS